MLEKWQSLLNQLEIIQTSYGNEFWSLDQLNKFEDETGIILPIGYKEYCQVFGSGGFGDFVGIYCPSLDFSNALLASIKNEILNFSDPQYEKMMDKESLINLLDHGLVFAGESCGISIFWDLRSYDESDQSYDIYWISGDCFDGDIYKIGRDLYEFVTEFCLGEKSFEILPKEDWRSEEAFQKTFTRVKPTW
ncbi:MAG: SMI1/KNR4 family protein [Patescibacteria group bacterium]